MTVDWELDNIGIVVRDMESAVKHYHRMGIEAIGLPANQQLDINSRPADFKQCFVQNQAVRFNLIQPAAASFLQEFLAAFGEGISHVEYRVTDLAAEKSRLDKLGVPVLASIKHSDGTDAEIFFDTRKVGNVITALFGERAGFPVFRPEPGNWKFHHLGYVTRDIFKFAEYQQALGFKIVAPPQRMDKALPQSVMDQWTIYGRIPKALPESRMGMCSLQNRSGTVGIGGNAPFAGNDLYQEFLDKHGDGIQHVHFVVNNLPVELANMVSLGFPCVLTQKTAEGRLQESYYDTREFGGVLIALWGGVEPPFKTAPES